MFSHQLSLDCCKNKPDATQVTNGKNSEYMRANVGWNTLWLKQVWVSLPAYLRPLYSSLVAQEELASYSWQIKAICGRLATRVDVTLAAKQVGIKVN